MGLLDVLNGMQNGPHGQRAPGSGGGMSPMTMAILALLAYKAVKGLGNQPSAAPAGAGSAKPATPSGGLGDLLPGGLGGLLAGGAAGSILSGGLNDLLKQFQQNGQGDAANSWVATGPNKAISPIDLSKVLDNEQIKMLMQQSGISREDLINGLSQALPGVIDQLTPHGRLPTAQELSH